MAKAKKPTGRTPAPRKPQRLTAPVLVKLQLAEVRAADPRWLAGRAVGQCWGTTLTDRFLGKK